MNKFGILVLTTVVALFSFVEVTSAQEGNWSFVGTWKMEVSCGTNNMINTVKIKKAGADVIIGTTNVGDGFGKIVSGNFDGKNVKFLNKFVYDGFRHSETWKGVLSQDGTYFKGSFRGTLQGDTTCQFAGARKSDGTARAAQLLTWSAGT